MIALFAVLASLFSVWSDSTMLLHRPVPSIEFPVASGSILGAEARTVPVKLRWIDSVAIEVRSASPESLLLRDNGGDPFRRVGSFRFTRGRGASAEWEFALDLDSIHRSLGGAPLELLAWCQPAWVDSSARPDSVHALAHYEIANLGMVATSTTIGETSLAIFDRAAGRPVETFQFLTDSAGKLQSKDVSSESSFRSRLGPGLIRRGTDYLFTSLGEYSEPRISNHAYDEEHRGCCGMRRYGINLKNPGSQEGDGDRRAGLGPHGFRIHPYLFRGVHRPGDSVTLGVLVRGPGGTLPSGHSLTISVEGNGFKYQFLCEDSESVQGHFQKRFRIPPDAQNGWASIEVGYSGSSASTGFRVDHEAPRKLRSLLDVEEIHGGRGISATLSGNWQTGRSASEMPSRIEIDWKGFAKGDSAHDAPLDRTGRSTLIKDFAWDSLGWKRVKYRAKAEILLPGGRSVPAAMRSGTIRYGREARCHVASDSQWVEITPLFLEPDWTKPRPGHAIRVRIADSANRSLVLDTVAMSSTTLRLPLSRFVGSNASSDLRKGRYLEIATWLASDSSFVVTEPLRTGIVDMWTGGVGKQKWGLVDFHGKPKASEIWTLEERQVLREDQDDAQESEDPRGIWSGDAWLDAADAPVPIGDSLGLCWESEGNGMSLVQVVQGGRILSEEWVRDTRRASCWKRLARSQWWPSVVVMVHRIAKEAGSGSVLVRQEGRSFDIAPDSNTAMIELEPLAPFRPNADNAVRIRNLSRIPGSVVVSSVDQGVLDLDDFKTPSPHANLEQDEELQVSWFQTPIPPIPKSRVPGWIQENLRDRYGLGSGDATRAARIAGGTANRVDQSIPEVWQSGPLALPDTGLVVMVPVGTYTGSLMISAMALAGRGGDLFERSVPVRAPLELEWGVPPVLSSDDEAEIELFVGADRARPFEIRWAASGSIALASPPETKGQFDPKGTASATATIKGLAQEGRGWIEARVRSGSDSAFGRIGMDVHSNMLGVARSVHGSDIDGDMALSLGDGKRAVGSPLRLELRLGTSVGISRRLRQLIDYPHRCLDQIVSVAWPQLHAASLLPAGDTAARMDAVRNVTNTIRSMGDYISPEGRIGLWPEYGLQANPWIVAQARLFLDEAKQAGYSVPGKLTKVFDQQIRGILEDTCLAPIERAMVLLSMRSMNDSASMERLSAMTTDGTAKWILAQAWWRSGRKERAWKEAKSARIEFVDKRELGGVFRSPLRDAALVAMAMREIGWKQGYEGLRGTILEALAGTDWMNTQELSNGLRFLAMNASVPSRLPTKVVDSSVLWNADGRDWRKLMLVGGTAATDLPYGTSKILLRWKSDSIPLHANVFWRDSTSRIAKRSEIPFDLGLAWEFQKGSDASPKRIRQGTGFECVVRVRNKRSFPVPNVVAMLLLPAGWEPKHSQLQAVRDRVHSSNTDYLDIRPERVMAYFDLEPGEERVLRIPLKAVTSGVFHGGSVSIEALYDGGMRTETRLGAVEVVK